MYWNRSMVEAQGTCGEAQAHVGSSARRTPTGCRCACMLSAQRWFIALCLQAHVSSASRWGRRSRPLPLLVFHYDLPPTHPAKFCWSCYASVVLTAASSCGRGSLTHLPPSRIPPTGGGARHVPIELDVVPPLVEGFQDDLNLSSSRMS